MCVRVLFFLRWLAHYVVVGLIAHIGCVTFSNYVINDVFYILLLTLFLVMGYLW